MLRNIIGKAIKPEDKLNLVTYLFAIYYFECDASRCKSMNTNNIYK